MDEIIDLDDELCGPVDLLYQKYDLKKMPWPKRDLFGNLYYKKIDLIEREKVE